MSWRALANYNMYKKTSPIFLEVISKSALITKIATCRPNEVCWRLLSLILVFCAGCAVNPISGEKQFMLFPPDQDTTIGQKYAPEIEKQMSGRIQNQTLQDYINSVGQKIVRISHNPNWQYQFVAVNDKSVNAVALPGGFIFITKGMLKNLKTEGQLASVLAHEIVHVVARHSSVAMSREIGIDILISAVISEQTGQNVKMVTGLARQIIGLRYSREDERQADLIGLDYITLAKYDPYAMVEIARMLQDQQQSRPVEFLSTHPAPKNRAAYLTEKIQTRYPNLKPQKNEFDQYQAVVLNALSN